MTPFPFSQWSLDLRVGGCAEETTVPSYIRFNLHITGYPTTGFGQAVYPAQEFVGSPLFDFLTSNAVELRNYLLISCGCAITYQLWLYLRNIPCSSVICSLYMLKQVSKLVVESPAINIDTRDVCFW